MALIALAAAMLALPLWRAGRQWLSNVLGFFAAAVLAMQAWSAYKDWPYIGPDARPIFEVTEGTLRHRDRFIGCYSNLLAVSLSTPSQNPERHI